MSKLIQPEGQDRKIFNAVKRIIKELPNLTDEQLAIISYETWHEAYKRSAKIVDESILDSK